MADVLTNTAGYLTGDLDITSDIPSYLRGEITANDNTLAYASGILRDKKPCFLEGNVLNNSSCFAFVQGPKEDVQLSIYAYLFGITRNSQSAYLEGAYMTSVDYIWLKTSDLSLEKKFRVLVQDYDDGTLEKAEEVNKTIGGGTDHSVGGVYKTWSMVVRVRHTETETNFGDKDDLETLYSLNNPNGTPSNDITFIDHHQVEYTVHTVGKMTKNLMGCEIEGECAWYLYKLQLLRVQ